MTRSTKKKAVLNRDEDQHRGNEALSDESPTLTDIMKMEPIKAQALAFVDENSVVLDDEMKRMIAAWAFRAGMASTLLKAEKALGYFGAGTILAAITEDDGSNATDRQALSGTAKCGPKKPDVMFA